MNCYYVYKHYWEAIESFAVRLVELRLVVILFCLVSSALLYRLWVFEFVLIRLIAWHDQASRAFLMVRCLGGCLVGVLVGLWPLSLFGLFLLVCCCFLRVGRYAYLTGGCAFLPYARWVVWLIATGASCTAATEAFAFLCIFSFVQLDDRTEPLSLIGHIPGKKHLEPNSLSTGGLVTGQNLERWLWIQNGT
jgi:hypothetical protein